MTYRGVTYDVGTAYRPGESSRQVWSRADAARDLRGIHDDLHCTSVGLYGTDLDRLDEAAELAHRCGLHVSPQLRAASFPAGRSAPACVPSSGCCRCCRSSTGACRHTCVTPCGWRGRNSPGRSPTARDRGRPSRGRRSISSASTSIRGADRLGGGGWTIVDFDAAPPVVKPGYVRSEAVPAALLDELLPL